MSKRKADDSESSSSSSSSSDSGSGREKKRRINPDEIDFEMVDYRITEDELARMKVEEFNREAKKLEADKISKAMEDHMFEVLKVRIRKYDNFGNCWIYGYKHLKIQAREWKQKEVKSLVYATVPVCEDVVNIIIGYWDERVLSYSLLLNGWWTEDPHLQLLRLICYEFPSAQEQYGVSKKELLDKLATSDVWIANSVKTNKLYRHSCQKAQEILENQLATGGRKEMDILANNLDKFIQIAMDKGYLQAEML